MNLVLYGTEADKRELLHSLSVLPEWCYRKIDVTAYSDYDSLVAGLDKISPDCVVIAMNGANGMEGVIAVRNLFSSIPIIWFSDDSGFGAQSYRLDCAYFHEKPISPQILSAAIAKCV